MITLVPVLETTLVLAACGMGIVALPWRDAELVESNRAFANLHDRLVGAVQRAWGTPDASLPEADPDELLPPASLLHRPEWSRAARMGHVRGSLVRRAQGA